MNKIEYNTGLETINREYELAKRTLATKYALSNAQFEKGDIIKNHLNTILVDKISVYRGNGSFPEPVYEGFILKKDFTRRQDGSRASIYGSDSSNELIKKGIV